MRYHAKGTKAVHLLTVSCALAFAVGLQVPGANAQGTVVAAAVGPKPQVAAAMRPASGTSPGCVLCRLLRRSCIYFPETSIDRLWLNNRRK